MYDLKVENRFFDKQCCRTVGRLMTKTLKKHCYAVEKISLEETESLLGSSARWVELVIKRLKLLLLNDVISLRVLDIG